MFELERAISEWRAQMHSAGVKSPALLEELEGHLRDDVEQQMGSGTSARESFEIASRRIGAPHTIENEFAKVGATRETRLQRVKNALLKFVGVPLPPRIDFAGSGRETLELGEKEALGFHHDFVGTEHILLGTLELETSGIAGVLQRMGVDHRAVRREIEKVVGLGPDQRVSPAPLRHTPRVKKALELASREAKAHQDTRVSAEHIFLGLLLEGGGVAALVLKNLGVEIRKAREEVLKELYRKPTDS